MRIAILIDSLAGGGAEKVMLTLASTFIRLGHRCDLVSLIGRTDYAPPSHVPIHYCYRRQERNIATPWRIATTAYKLQALLHTLAAEGGEFDLYLSNLDKTNLVMARLNLPNVYYVIHNAPLQSLRDKRYNPFKWLALRQAFKVLNGKNLVAVSQGVAEGIRLSPYIKPNSVQAIYNPIVVDSAIPAVPNLIPAEPFVLFVGRAARQKRVDILFEALQSVKSPHKLVMLCANVKKIKKIALRFGVLDRVIFPGFQNNPSAWMKAASAVLLSSDFEGFPTVLLESLACGTPVVSTDCDFGPREILTDELQRWLVPTGNPGALAQKIDELLQLNPPLNIGTPDILRSVQPELVAQKYLALIPG